MGCDEVMRLLDAYIDGELPDAQMRMLEEHAKACEACREELAAATLLKDTLEHMEDGIAVPLQAQAAWRSAVRAEMAKKKKKTWMRYASAAAAVFVLALGINFAFDNQNDQNVAAIPMMLASGMDNAEYALVASDGLEEAAVQMDAQYTIRRKISAESADGALEKLELLAREYSGSFAREGENACRIEIPMDYLQDFTKASERIGENVYSEAVGEGGETAVILIQITEK